MQPDHAKLGWSALGGGLPSKGRESPKGSVPKTAVGGACSAPNKWIESARAKYRSLWCGSPTGSVWVFEPPVDEVAVWDPQRGNAAINGLVRLSEREN